jgi:hypothetical protein
MRRLALVAAALALLLPPAADATRLRAVGICGTDRCLVSTRASLLRELEAVVDGDAPSEPRPADSSFYLVDMLSTTGGVLGKAAFLPTDGTLYWRPKPGDDRWIALSSRASALMRAGAAGAAPYEPPLEPVLGIAAVPAAATEDSFPWVAVLGVAALVGLALGGGLLLVRRQRA